MAEAGLHDIFQRAVWEMAVPGEAKRNIGFSQLQAFDYVDFSKGQPIALQGHLETEIDNDRRWDSVTIQADHFHSLRFFERFQIRMAHYEGLDSSQYAYSTNFPPLFGRAFNHESYKMERAFMLIPYLAEGRQRLSDANLTPTPGKLVTHVSEEEFFIPDEAEALLLYMASRMTQPMKRLGHFYDLYKSPQAF